MSPCQAQTIDPGDVPQERIFELLIAAVVPRPIAWTSTVGLDGVRNLAPFSFYTVVSSRPPMLCLSIEAAGDGTAKDTLRNIETTGEFVVNTVSADAADLMYGTSLEHAADVDEFEACGVTPAPSARVRPPSVGESKISMECVLHTTLRPGSDTLVIGEVVAFHLAPGVLSCDGRVDIDGLHPLGRVDSRFIQVGNPFRLPTGRRPQDAAKGGTSCG
ncbi:flavin reductase family protein [Nonomuraea mangrovi]|uniref:Flavin reductase family protein n=1 Tax=Nonomuraea mangrovi TaxID=2316207 RepID=A0ABW4SS25_9ACTN